MAQVEERLVAKLLATSGVTNLVGARIRPVALRQTDTLPAIVYQRVGTDSVNHATGECNVAFARIQVDCLASTYAAAKTLATAVKAALSGWSDLTGDPDIDLCHWLGDQDMPGDFEPGQDVLTHGVMQDYRIQYNTTG
jgi:hypothetical protein